MTFEIYRPGAENPIVYPVGEFFEGITTDDCEILLQSMGTGSGIRAYSTDLIGTYEGYKKFDQDQSEEDPEDRVPLEEQYNIIPKGVSIQLADGVIAKAT